MRKPKPEPILKYLRTAPPNHKRMTTKVQPAKKIYKRKEKHPKGVIIES